MTGCADGLLPSLNHACNSVSLSSSSIMLPYSHVSRLGAHGHHPHQRHASASDPHHHHHGVPFSHNHRASRHTRACRRLVCLANTGVSQRLTSVLDVAGIYEVTEALELQQQSQQYGGTCVLFWVLCINRAWPDVIRSPARAPCASIDVRRRRRRR